MESVVLKDLKKSVEDNPQEEGVLLTYSHALLRDLDDSSKLAEDLTQGKRMKIVGRELQKLAAKIMASHNSQLNYSFGRFFQLRGLGYEGEGLLTEAFGLPRALPLRRPIIQIAEKLAGL